MTELRLCPRCKRRLPLNAFHRNKAKKSGVASVCIECKSNYNKTWYEQNREAHKANTRKNAQRYKQLALELTNEAKAKPCQDCGTKYPPYVMDLHHENPVDKIDSVSTMVMSGRPLKVIQQEILKCIVLCANCHRTRTHNEEWLLEESNLPTSGLGDPSPESTGEA